MQGLLISKYKYISNVGVLIKIAYVRTISISEFRPRLSTRSKRTISFEINELIVMLRTDGQMALVART